MIDASKNVEILSMKNVRYLILTISCQLRLLLARANVERARQNKPALSLRRLAEESGVSLSVLASLHTGKNQRIDYTTIDHLLTYFNRYFQVTTDDLLTWEFTSDIEKAHNYQEDAIQRKTSFA
jgi:hypothetical protein